MASKTFRELTANTAPASDRIIATQAPSGSAEPQKTTMAQLGGSLPFNLNVTGSVERSLAAKVGEVVSVRDFGIVGDETDESAKWANAVASNRRLIVPPPEGNHYLCATQIDFKGLRNFEMEGIGRPKIVGTHSVGGIFGTVLSTGVKPQDLTPIAALTGISRVGTRVVTLADPDDVNKPEEGDFVLIKTGNLIGTPYIPLSEYNKVDSIDGDEITLVWPLRWTFRDMGDDEDFGIVVINDYVCENVTLRGFHFEHLTVRACFKSLGYNQQFIDNIYTGNGAVVMRGRFLDFDGIVDLTPNWGTPPNGFRPYAFATDSGSSDIRARIRGQSRGSAIVHIHESISNFDLDIDLSMGDEDAGALEQWGVLSLRAVTKNGRAKVRVNSHYSCGATGDGVITSRGSAVYGGWGNSNIVVDDLSISGRITNATNNARALAHGSAQAPIVVRSIETSEAIIDDPSGFGGGATWRERRTVTLPIDTGQTFSSTAAQKNGKLVRVNGSYSTFLGEDLIDMPDAAANGGQAEIEVPAGGWTDAIFEFELVHVDGTDGGDAYLRTFGQVGATATAIDYTSPQSAPVVTMPFGKAGSPRFVTVPVTIGANARVGARINRDGAAAQDTLDGFKLGILRCSVYFGR